ncbi:MAG: hypothetical protein K1X86_11165 [Ignavibacteria bacterium]|nr:hypothetical protein [Ignavibacteria bacterium]
MDNDIDEKFIEDFLKSLTLKPTRFPKNKEEKSPDFKVETQNGFLFFCEVKSIEIETSKEGLLYSTIYNCITTRVHKAFKQFESVNALRFVPNVLIFISHNFQINFKSFEELLIGKLEIEGDKIADFSKYKYGKFKNEIKSIDLVIFFNGDVANYFYITTDFISQLTRIFPIPITRTIKG